MDPSGMWMPAGGRKNPASESHRSEFQTASAAPQLPELCELLILTEPQFPHLEKRTAQADDAPHRALGEERPATGLSSLPFLSRSTAEFFHVRTGPTAGVSFDAPQSDRAELLICVLRKGDPRRRDCGIPSITQSVEAEGP